MSLDIVAEGLAFPEGPVAMPGSYQLERLSSWAIVTSLLKAYPAAGCYGAKLELQPLAGLPDSSERIPPASPMRAWGRSTASGWPGPIASSRRSNAPVGLVTDQPFTESG